MTFYELEGKINEYIKEHNLDNAKETHLDNYKIDSKLQNIIVELLGGEDLFKSYGLGFSYSKDNQGFYLARKQLSVWVGYKRTRYIEEGHWNNYAYYGIKDVEICCKDSFKDLQDFINQDNELDKRVQKDHKEKYEDMFSKVGVNFHNGGFTLKELLAFRENFKKLSNAEQKEMFDNYNNGEIMWLY